VIPIDYNFAFTCTVDVCIVARVCCVDLYIFCNVCRVGSLVEIDEHVNEIIQLCEEDIVQHTLQVLRFVLEY